MEFPQTPDDLEREILICSDKSSKLGDLRLRQLIRILSKVNPEMIVEAIIRIFENNSREEQYLQDQEFAGKILEAINPLLAERVKGSSATRITKLGSKRGTIPFLVAS
jgi:ribosomal protein L17